MTTKQLVAFLMDLADSSRKVKSEVKGMVASNRPITADEHEAIKNLLLEIESNIGVADVIRAESYGKTKTEKFAVVK